jgi:hypothetical protein
MVFTIELPHKFWSKKQNGGKGFMQQTPTSMVEIPYNIELCFRSIG